METTNHNTLEGDVSLNMDARPLIKLSTDPSIAICVPVGTKDTVQIGIDPEGRKWAGPGVRIPALVPIQWALTLLRIVPPLNVSITYFSQWGLLSGEARQIMTTAALKRIRDDGYILYLDDDTLVPREGLYKLFNYMQQHPEVGIAAGVYTTRSDPPVPLVFKEHGGGVYWNFESGPNAKPEAVWAMGSGCMLARASAIKKIIASNPEVPVWADATSEEVTHNHDNEEVLSRITFGHDIRFCKLMWEAGFEVHVHGQVICDHFDIQTQTLHRLSDVKPDNAPEEMPEKQAECETQKSDVSPASATSNLKKDAPLSVRMEDAINKQTKVEKQDAQPTASGDKKTKNSGAP